MYKEGHNETMGVNDTTIINKNFTDLQRLIGMNFTMRSTTTMISQNINKLFFYNKLKIKVSEKNKNGK